MGTTTSGQSIEIRESTRVPPGETQLVRLSIGELEAGSYRFEARGISPLSFLESTELKYKHKVSIFRHLHGCNRRRKNKKNINDYGLTILLFCRATLCSSRLTRPSTSRATRCSSG